MSFHQNTTGTMNYPAQGTLNRLLFHIPAIWWRMGMGPIQGRWQLVLTTWGRRSRLPRHTMLSRATLGDKSYVISGWNQRADWYQNLSHNPRVTVQTDRNTYHARARRITELEEYTQVMRLLLEGGGDSHFKPWLKSLGIQLEIDDIVAKRERVYLVALDPSDEAGHPPPMAVDLKWVWVVVALSFVSGWLLRGWASKPSQ